MSGLAAIMFALLPATVPPPPIIDDRVAPQQSMLSWRPGDVQCDGVAVPGARIGRPPSRLVWGTAPTKSLQFHFRIDAAGRPLTIVRAGAATPYIDSADDMGAALAASRFAATERRACSVTFTADQQPLTSVPVDDLIAYSLAPASGPLPKAAWDRIPAPGTTCTRDPRPEPLLRAFPDFLALPETPGVRDWTLLAYDTNRAGKPLRIRSVAGTGNVALDRAGTRAIAASRFTGGARTGCLYPYWRRADRLPAPPLPEERAFRQPTDTCPERHDWATAPVLRFPEAYRQRMIEGWAIVRYDIATWGEVGNVKILAAEPTDDFGRQAEQLLRGAKAPPSPQGAVGCVDRVRFVMGSDAMPPNVDMPPRPVY